jgi:triphosphoribosyl-dephospho-CoA synthetase
MTRRQEYWQDLRIIRSATGTLNRRMSFAAAREWVMAYTDDITIGHDQPTACQRAYDYLVCNKRQTLISKSEVRGYAWNF